MTIWLTFFVGAHFSFEFNDICISIPCVERLGVKDENIEKLGAILQKVWNIDPTGCKKNVVDLITSRALVCIFHIYEIKIQNSSY